MPSLANVAGILRKAMPRRHAGCPPELTLRPRRSCRRQARDASERFGKALPAALEIDRAGRHVRVS
ncbi:MAG: hypothetical protein ABI520_14195 [Caldimonas sp.]